MTVLHYEFAPSVGRYLAALGPDAPMRSLADIQAFNNANAAAALKFRQVHVDTAVAIDHEREREAYEQARARDLKFATDHLLAALGDTLECLVFPGATGCSWAARAGWPSIVVPGRIPRRQPPAGGHHARVPAVDRRAPAAAGVRLASGRIRSAARPSRSTRPPSAGSEPGRK